VFLVYNLFFLLFLLQFFIVNSNHSFPQVVGLLLWLVELCETQSNFNVMETLYPSNFDLDEAENEDHLQTLEFEVKLSIDKCKT
jgi:hypothetical protein